jgi:gentisate 1,2-dioxygenase
MEATTANPFYVKPDLSPERADFYARLSERNAAPLWEVLGRLVLPHPQPASVPCLWKYAELRPLIMEGGRLITAKQAERRVVVLENAGMRGMSQITQTLYAGLQLILPGETAPTHRHAASALRFIVEGSGAYTAVDGERTMMQPGDFILTPSWTFHDHGNPGDEPVVWLDGLDIPLVNMFDTSFAEHHPREIQPEARPVGDVLHRFGANMLPVEFTPSSPSSPLFVYPYARTRAALTQVHRSGPLHPSHGIKLQYVNPVTGGYPIPTIAAFMQHLPSGFRGEPYRGTDGTVFSVVEGHGESRVGDHVFEWGPRDVFVVPSWVPVSHSAREDAFLFSFSDRAAQKALGLWREEVPTRI